jgi:hypothetical protein
VHIPQWRGERARSRHGYHACDDRVRGVGSVSGARRSLVAPRRKGSTEGGAHVPAVRLAMRHDVDRASPSASTESRALSCRSCAKPPAPARSHAPRH